MLLQYGQFAGAILNDWCTDYRAQSKTQVRTLKSANPRGLRFSTVKAAFSICHFHREMKR